MTNGPLVAYPHIQSHSLPADSYSYSSHSHSQTTAGIYNPLPDFKQMIASRLHLPPGAGLPFLFCEGCKVGDVVHLFVVASEQSEPVILTDEWGLFPSDKLITQLRIIYAK